MSDLVEFKIDKTTKRYKKAPLTFDVKSLAGRTGMPPLDGSSLEFGITDGAARRLVSGRRPARLETSATKEQVIVSECEVDPNLFERKDQDSYSLIKDVFEIKVGAKDARSKAAIGWLKVRIHPPFYVRLNVEYPGGRSFATCDERSVITVKPDVTVNGKPYSGKVRLSFDADTGEPYSDDYFNEEPPGAGVPSALRLRCLLHLKSDDQLRVLPASGEDREFTFPADKVQNLRVHFEEEKLRDQYPEGIKVDETTKVRLRGATVTITAKPAVTIPAAGALKDHDRRLFTAAITVSIFGGDGNAIGAGTLPRARGSWRLAVTLTQGQGPSQRDVYEPAKARAGDIDAGGRVMFDRVEEYAFNPEANKFTKSSRAIEAQNHYLYNHESWYWRPDTYMFTSEHEIAVKAEFGREDVADQEVAPDKILDIGRQIPALTCSWDIAGCYISRGEFIAWPPETHDSVRAKLMNMNWTPTAYDFDRQSFAYKDRGGRELDYSTLPQFTVLIVDKLRSGIVADDGRVLHYRTRAGSPREGKQFNRDQIFDEINPVAPAQPATDDEGVFRDAVTDWFVNPQSPGGLWHRTLEVWMPPR